MVRQTSAAGPFRVRLSEIDDSDIAVGETRVVDTRTLKAGPRNKRGGLKKYYGARGGFDFVQVVNSTDEILAANTDGSVEQDVPPSTSVNVSGAGPNAKGPRESASYTKVAVTNTGIANNAVVKPEEVAVAFGNQPRPEESESGEIAFEPLDFVPGLVRNG